ncbi:ANTAR domain-containing protein [Pseudomonas arsenicoxydans]|uniref:Chemotaxis protein CheY n=1 Tax=Pseudomonas arsenicoxydans TaxID=702115 RepID=A0A4P6G9Y6_9PSED|nr:response regulator [Pseudomonas arsenicoxydans]QAY87266.1 chemotaxis protein CheY [Pseudomonas arsenicoxydans]
MPNKALRILIADEQHFHRMKIERLFNQLGYYRVAPVEGLAPMLSLVEYGCEPFDLVVVNASLVCGELDVLGYFLDNRQVRHALIFDGQRAHLPPTLAGGPQRVQVSHAPLPDMTCIQRLMTMIDPPLSEGQYPWPSMLSAQTVG